MTIRIALAGIAHETNTFVARPTTYDDFVANGLFRGAEIEQLAGTNHVAGGVLLAARAMPDVEVIPILITSAIPGGLVTADAINRIEGEIVAGIAAARPDAVVLDLHGAMATELSPDGEGPTLRRVREVVGPDMPVMVVLDLHTNLSDEMVALATMLIPYNTYPHVDNEERGAEALHHAVAAARGEVRPVSTAIRLPIFPNGPRQFSGIEPTKSIMARAFEMETQPSVLNVGVCFSFPYADCPFPGMNVIATTDNDPALADRLAHDLANMIWDRHGEFMADPATVEDAVHRAMAADRGPVVLADLGDNPGGGTACDGTAILWALLDLGASNAALAVMADTEAVDAAFAAGVGATISINLGGKTDDYHGYPIPVTATVNRLSDGHFTYEGPMNGGQADTLGRTAVLACQGRHGNVVEVIVAERRVQALDCAIFRSQGIEPLDKQIVVVKSAVHFRSGFGPIAAEIIEVDTPGLNTLHYERLPYRILPRPVWPIDPIEDHPMFVRSRA